MNKKIVGIFVCMLITTPIAIVTGDTGKKTMDTSVDHNSDIIVYEINDANPSERSVYSEYNTNGFFDYILDQKQELNTGSERIQDISGGLAQSFTPSMSPLSKVAILYTKSSGTPEFANYYLEVRADIHSSSYLRKTQIISSELPSGNIWLTWTLSDLAVTIGNSYWIVVYADSPTIYTTQIKWCYGSPGDPYPNGYSMINGFIGWQAYDLWGDFCFRTYAQSSNHPPNTPTTPTGSTTGTVGTSYSYSTSGIDPDTDQVKYCFDWGDGSPNSWTSLVSSGSAGSASHLWSSSGTFQVRAKSQDEHGFESSWSSSLSVTISAMNNPPIKPSTPSGPSSGKPGTSYSYSASAIDPDGDQVYLMFDWGDETPLVWKGPFNSGYVDIESHIWDAQGAYSVKVQAKDTKDGISVWSDSLPITMPYSFNRLQFLELLFQRFPTAFLLLRQLIGY